MTSFTGHEQDFTYLHGVRADDVHWTDVWNFSLAGTRSSIGLVALSMGCPHPTTLSIDMLRGDPRVWPDMPLSAFLVAIRMGGLIRAEVPTGMGVPPYPTHWHSRDQMAQTLGTANREIVLEEARRSYAPDAPSRLCCLWLAENTLPARNWVQGMTGTMSFLVEVKVTLLASMCRVDAQWLSLLVADDHTDEEALQGYWSGHPRPDREPLWEFLLEGQITATDAGELARLQAFIKDYGPPKDLLRPPVQPGELDALS